MRKLIVSSAFALIALAGITGTARADDYNGSCADVPASVDGNIFLGEPDCEIDHAISASGDIVFNYGNVSAKGMTAGGNIDLNTTSFTGDGNISAQGYVRIRSQNDIAVDGDVATVTAGSVRLEASGNVSVNNVTSAPDSHIIIYSNYSFGQSGKFYIGGSGHSNGINGTAISDYALYVYNGFGGIEVVDPTKIAARAVLLDALDDSIKIGSGLLSTDAYNDGTIQLLADSIEFESGAILSSKNGDSSGQVHGIALNAKTITYDGDLTLNADGDGTSGRHGFVYLFTKGTTTINMLGSIYNPFINITNTNTVVDELTVTGTGSGTLNVTANGNYMDVVVQGYPIAFNTAGDINMFAKGSEGHGIYVRNLNNRNDQTGVAFSGATGKVMLDASGDGGNGGTVEISADNILLDQDRFDIKVDGPEGGSGNGGTITLSGTQIAQSQTKSAFSANASGTGNGGLVLIAPGESNLNVGENLADAGSVGVIYLAAKGGETSGNGGHVRIFDMTGDLTVNGSKADTNAIDVSVAGPTGDGGTIDLDIDGDILFKPKDTEGDAGFVANSGITDGKGGSILLKAKGFEANDVSVKFQANGVDTGAGGTIDVQLEESLFIAYGIGAYSFEARNTDASADWLNGNADGGTIKISSEDELSLYGGALGVDGGNKGGTIEIKADILSVSGNFSADGGAQGDGGIVNFDFVTMAWQDASDNTRISAKGNGSGNGGKISIKSRGSQEIKFGLSAEEISLEAFSNESGDGGIIDVSHQGNIIISDESMSVNAGPDGDGDGGTITIATQGEEGIISLKGAVYAQGEGLGQGGFVEFKAYETDVTDENAFVFATQGYASEDGGNVILQNAHYDPGTSMFDKVEVILDPVSTFNKRQKNIASKHFIGASKNRLVDPIRAGTSITLDDLREQLVQKCTLLPRDVNDTSWPREFWDCGESEEARDWMVPGIDALTIKLKERLETKVKPRLVIFPNEAALLKFLNLSQNPEPGHVLGKVQYTQGVFISLFADTQTITDESDSRFQTVIHESGHAIDKSFPVPISSRSEYARIVKYSLFRFDFEVDGVTRIPPCGANGLFSIEVEICNSDGSVKDAFSNLSNTAILKELSYSVQSAEELHAQFFAIQGVNSSFPNDPANQLKFSVDIWLAWFVKLDKFPCLTAVAANEWLDIEGDLFANPSQGCSSAAPESYIPFSTLTP